jgi:hypothetical protein
MKHPSAEIAADRARMKAILDLPEASSQLRAAVALALEGASIDEAKTVLRITSAPLTADEVAALINASNKNR